jgi:uncharacterized membrane protein YoaK (UPF0700 family)
MASVKALSPGEARLRYVGLRIINLAFIIGAICGIVGASNFYYFVATGLCVIGAVLLLAVIVHRAYRQRV